MAKRDKSKVNGEGRRKRRGRGLRRTLSALAFLPVASRAPMYARLLWTLMTDERIPAVRKGVLGAALGYLLLGRDIVPDDLPLIGGLDDLVVVVLAIDLFLDGVPDEILHESLDHLGIERSAFEADVARVRRLMPGPVRRTIHRLSAAVDLGGRTWRDAGIGPRFRTWLKEDRLS